MPLQRTQRAKLLDMSDSASNGAFDRIGELLDFPAQFPIKVMGAQHDDFVDVIGDLVREHIPGFSNEDIKVSQSRNGNFISLTVSATVESRDQLEKLYMALADHDMVRIVL
jgi:putative lipoic acid-binding regulatory protein